MRSDLFHRPALSSSPSPAAPDRLTFDATGDDSAGGGAVTWPGEGPDEPEDFDEDDDLDTWVPIRPRRPIRSADPRLAREGRSGRARPDVDRTDAAGPDDTDVDRTAAAGPDDTDPDRPTGPESGFARAPESPFSSYDVATHGPQPAPEWLITALAARDTRLGSLKSGKEADVSLLDRSLPGGPGCLLAVKTYRDNPHRMFHRDAAYQEGRRTRRSREGRAMAARTTFGRELLAGRWATAEFAALSTLWQAGTRVPYPVQIIGTELMMEFVGDPDGRAAPRLAAYDGGTDDFVELWYDLVQSLEKLAGQGLTHGDLSAYNVLVRDSGCVLIDLPQVVDIVANPQGLAFLERDCTRIADFFARRGVRAADADRLTGHLASIANR